MLQFVVIPGGAIEIFLAWLVGCAPVFRVKRLAACMEEAQDASLGFVCRVC